MLAPSKSLRKTGRASSGLMIASSVENVLTNKVNTCRMPTPAYPASPRVPWLGIYGPARLAYFVIIRLVDGGASLGAAGEITNVNQAFQPSGRFSEANSL